MTSKISAGKSADTLSIWSLMREDLRRRAWMIALSVLGNFLVSPVAALFFNSRRQGRYVYFSNLPGNGEGLSPAWVLEEITADITGYLCSIHLGMQTAVLLIGAVIVAVFGFRYLYSRRMVDLYHSAPVRRSRLFLAHWLNGFLIWLVPFLAGNLCVYLLMLFYFNSRLDSIPYLNASGASLLPCFGSIGWTMIRLILLCILCFLIVYNACLVAVMVSGNLTNALVNLLAYGLVVLIGNATFLGYMSVSFQTCFVHLRLFATPLVVALSPLASPVFMALNFSEGTLLAARFLLPSALLMAANFALAMFLHGKRASELAERGLEARWFRIPMRFAVSYLSGLLLALFFINISDSIGWSVFGAVFGSVLAFAVLNIIYHGGFKFLFLHRIQLALAVLAVLGTGCVFAFDLFGYDTYVPDEADITGMSLFCSAFTGDSYYLKKTENGSYTRAYTGYPDENLVFTDSAAIHGLLEALTEEIPGYTGDIVTFCVKVNTRHGSYYRRYRVKSCALHIDAIRPFIESEAYRECYYPISLDTWEPPYSIEIDNPFLSMTEKHIESPEQIRQLHEAYQKDFLELYSMDRRFSGSGQYRLTYYYPLENADGRRLTSFSVPLGREYRHVAALLDEWYPDRIWSFDDLTPDSLSIQISLDGDDPDDLYRYFGLPVPSSGQEQPVGTAEADGTAFFPTPNSWETRITNPAGIEAWKPYLIYEENNAVSFISGKDYVYLGYASFTWEQPDSASGYERGQDVECFVKKGVLPAELVDGLAELKRSGH